MSDTIILVGSALGAVLLIIILIVYLLKGGGKQKKESLPKQSIQPKIETSMPSMSQMQNSKPLEESNQSNEMSEKIKEDIEKPLAISEIERQSKKTIRDFYIKYPRFNMDSNLIKKELLEIEYAEINKTELRNFLVHNGITPEQTNEILDTLKIKHFQKNNTKMIESSISHYKNLGWNDQDIKNHFFSEGYSSDIISDAFKEYYKRNIYRKYLQNIVSHMKPFLISGKSGDEITNKFIDNKWPEELVKEALDIAIDEVKEEESTLFLEEQIFKIIIKGDHKECFARALSKKDWPEQILKQEFKDLNQGFDEFERSLEKIDLNNYNIEKIKDSLRDKSWPEKFINKITNNLVEKTKFHKNLISQERAIKERIESGDFSSEKLNSQKLKEQLILDGWDSIVIKKMIDKINNDLIKLGKKDKVRDFNSHIFNKSKYQNLKSIVANFDSVTFEKIDEKEHSLIKNEDNN